MGLTFKLKSTKFLIFFMLECKHRRDVRRGCAEQGRLTGLHTSERCPDVTFVPLNISISCVTHVYGKL